VRSILFAPEALADLRNLYDTIADGSLPERGTRRDAIRPGLRTIGYRR